MPLYLGVRAVIAKSFARIHVANLINAGILPLCFETAEDYDRVAEGDTLTLENVREGLSTGRFTLRAGEKTLTLVGSFSERQRAILLAGGLLNYTRETNA